VIRVLAIDDHAIVSVFRTLVGESELSRVRDWLISRTRFWGRKRRTWRTRAFHHG
jgi:hypothetical protein